MKKTSFTQTEEQHIINRVSVVTIAGNTVLSLFKLTAGIFGHSGAMVSDAIHSISDIVTTVIAWLGVRLSRRDPDREHPYGHDRLECVASLILGTVLMMTGLAIGASALRQILSGNYETLAIPGKIALAAAILSIAAKEAMFWYTRYYAKLLNSAAFLADAWHHRSDALSSVGSFIGIGGAMLGFPVLDPVASVGICICILKVSYDILMDAIRKMLDTACDPDFEQEVGELISRQDGVERLDMLQTRIFGSKIYIDAEISVDGTKSLAEAHEIAQKVHDRVETGYSDIKHIMIHVNPS